MTEPNNLIPHYSVRYNKEITAQLQTYSITRLQQLLIAHKTTIPPSNIARIQKIQNGKICAVVHSSFKKQYIIEQIDLLCWSDIEVIRYVCQTFRIHMH